MKRAFALILAVLFVVCFNVNLYATSVKKTDRGIINGVSDENYTKIISYPENVKNLYSPENALLKDRNVSLSLAYDDDYLYVFVELSGSTKGFDNPFPVWYGNGIVLATGSEKPVIYSIAEYSSKFNLSCVYDGGIKTLSDKNRYKNRNLPENFLSVTSKKCVYEFKADWKNLGISYPCDGFYFNAAIIFNSVPYLPENVCGIEMKKGLVSALLSENYENVPMEYLSFGKEKPEETPPHVHIKGETVIEKNSTCKENGIGKIYCVSCGELLSTEKLPKAEHIPDEEKITRFGGFVYYTVYCKNCGCIISEISESENSENALTPEEKTEITNVFSGGKTTEKPHKHQEGKWETVTNPTCQSEGFRIKRCKTCGEKLREETVKKKNHTAGAFITVKIPTDKEDGLMEKRCKNCGALILSKTVKAGLSDFSKSSLLPLKKRLLSALISVNLLDENLYTEEAFEKLNFAFLDFLSSTDGENEDEITRCLAVFEREFENLEKAKIKEETDFENIITNKNENGGEFLAVMVTMPIFAIITLSAVIMKRRKK